MKVLIRVGFSVVGFLVGKILVVLLPVWASVILVIGLIGLLVYIEKD